MFVTLPNPHLKVLTRPSTPKVLRARERVPNSLLFRCFHLRLTFESIKKVRGASLGLQTPKVEAPLGVWRFIPSHFPSLSSSSWPTTLQALALVASPRLGLQQLVSANQSRNLTFYPLKKRQRMLAQATCQPTSPCNLNLKFGYSYMQNLFIMGWFKFCNVDFGEFNLISMPTIIFLRFCQVVSKY